MHEINCAGNESRLIDCERHVYTHFYCHHSENVAIACDGKILITSKYHIYIVESFGGRKFWQNAAHNTCGWVALHSNSSRIKIVVDKPLVDWSWTANSAKFSIIFVL